MSGAGFKDEVATSLIGLHGERADNHSDAVTLNSPCLATYVALSGPEMDIHLDTFTEVDHSMSGGLYLPYS